MTNFIGGGGWGGVATGDIKLFSLKKVPFNVVFVAVAFCF